MYQKLQDNRLAKATQEARKNVGSTTIAEAQAGMASKDGLVGARKQLSEVSKLEKMLENSLLQEIGVVDLTTLDGDAAGGGDQDGKDDKAKAKAEKEQARKEYLGENGHLNERFFNLNEKDQEKALTVMGMSAAAIKSLGEKREAVKAALAKTDATEAETALIAAGVSAETAADVVSDIKDLKDLKAALREVINVGKVSDRETLNAGKGFYGRGVDKAMDRYVGSDQRLNAKFYALSEDKQAAALIKMGVVSIEAKAFAKKGTQASQDAKMKTVAEQREAISTKQSERLDSRDASLNIQAKDLQSGLDKGAYDLATLAKYSRVHVSETYIADDGSVKPLANAPVGSTVFMVLMRADSPDQQAVVQVSKKALENLDFENPATQTVLGNLDGLGGGGDIALVANIRGISQEAISQEAIVLSQVDMSRKLSGVQKDLSNLGEGGAAREMRTLQALGRMEKITMAREVETLGAELLRREDVASAFEDPESKGPTNQEKKEAITARLRDLQDFRPAQRNALRKEIALHREKQADGLDNLPPEAKQRLKDNHILNADGTLNAQEVARLQANPEDADRVFAAVAGIDGGALKAKVFGQAKQEKLKKLEKQLEAMEVEGIRAMGLDPALTPSARIRLAASDANSDPKRVRDILQAQAVAFREQALTEAEAEDNLDGWRNSFKDALSSKALFGLRVGGAIVTAGATELAMGISSLNKSPAVKKAEKEKKNDLERAKAATNRGIDRVAAAKKFQEDVDQLVGVDANARLAGEFVDAYKKAVTEAKTSSDEAKKENPSRLSRLKDPWKDRSFFSGGKLDQAMDLVSVLAAEPLILSISGYQDAENAKTKAVDTTQTNVLTALVAERDAAVKIRKLVQAKDPEQAADILRYMAAGGSEGQALAAGVLRRLAANGDDVRGLVDRAAAGASPDQLRGLGGAVLQAMGQDARFKDLELTDGTVTGFLYQKMAERAKRTEKWFKKKADDSKENSFDDKLGALYGMSGWHKTKADSGARNWGESKASAKSERGASDFATLMGGSKGFNRALASASEDDMSALLRNLPTERVTAILSQLSEAAKLPSVAAAKSQANVTAGTGNALGVTSIHKPSSLLNFPMGSDVSTRDDPMNDFEVAFKKVMRKGPTVENAAAVSAALAAVNRRDGVDAAIALLQKSAAIPSVEPSNMEKQTMLKESGDLVKAISEKLKEQLKLAWDLDSAEGRENLQEQLQRFDSRRDGMLAALARDGAESRLQAQQAFVKMAAAINGMNDDGTTNGDKTTKAYTADLVLSLASTVAAGLQTSFSETTVQSDYFKKLNEAVVRPGSEKGAAIDGTVTSLAEIAQKLKQDPIGAGAELENVKDRVATVIESAVAQGHVEEVLRVLAQLRQAGLIDLVKDLGALVAVRGDGDLALAALDSRSKSLLGTSDDERSRTQKGYAEALDDFKIGVLDKDSRVADKIVQAQVDTAKKESALRDIAHKMVSGDVALVKAVLADSSLRQDLASLVAEGVALDMPSAYRILSLIGEKPQKEVALFAEAVGIRLAAVNVDIKTSSRKVDLKQMKETLTAMDKTGSKRKEIEAFAKQIEQGYGVQLYASAPLRGLSRQEQVQVFAALVAKNKTPKAESMFRDLAMRNPQAAANLMTDALRETTPTLANTLYAAISKEIPGANGRTLTQIQSLITAFQAEPLPVDFDFQMILESGNLGSLMAEDLATIATAQRDQDLPRGSLLFNSALSTMVTRGDDGTLSISEGQKPIALAQVQQEASLMYANLPSLMGQEDPNPAFTAAFTKIKYNPTSMIPDDFSTLTTLAGELPPTQARELRLLVGFAAMALPQEGLLTDEMRHQQVLDMISVGQGAQFSSQMVADALGSPGAGKLDAVESLLKNNPAVLELTKESASSVPVDNSVYGQIMAALKDSNVDPTQRRFLLQPGGALDRKLAEQLSTLSLDQVIAFDQAQVSAGVSLSPSHFPTKLESEADKLDPPKGAAVKTAMANVANGTQTMKAALMELCSVEGALVDTNLQHVLADIMAPLDSAVDTLDALGTLKGAMADLQTPANAAEAKLKIQTFLSDPIQSAMLKAQQPGLYLSVMATADLSAGVVGDDAAIVDTYRDAVNAYLSPTVTPATIDTMQSNLIAPFLAGDSNAAAAMVLIAAADAGLARPCLPSILANMTLSVDERDLTAKLNALAGMAASTNLGASHVLSRAATVLREKLAVGSHAVLKDLAEKALRHHHKGQSYERELSSMSGHVHMHKASFVDAMKVAPYNRAQDIAEKEVDKNASSEGGIPGMLTLLDAQDKALSGAGSAFAADAKTMKIAKRALVEVYIDTLIKDDTESISGMDRQLATVLVDSLKEGMAQIMPRLKHRLKSSESTDRLMALIGQANIPLEGTGGMGELRAAVVKAADIFNMEDHASATATLGMLQQDTDLAARTLALYTDPKDAAAILNKLVAYQDGDAAFAGGLLGRMPEPNLSGPVAQNYWNTLFGSLEFAQDASSLAALRSGIQSPILAERFNVYLGTIPGMANQVSSFQISSFQSYVEIPNTPDTPEDKFKLRVNVAMTMGQSPGSLPGTMAEIKQDAMAMLSMRYADKALNEMMANPQARAMLGRLVAEAPASVVSEDASVASEDSSVAGEAPASVVPEALNIRKLVVDIVVAGNLPLSTLGGVLKLPGVAADLRAIKLEKDPNGKLSAHINNSAPAGLLLAKVMGEPSLVGQLHEDDLGPLTNQLLLYGDPTGVLPHLMENPHSMAMIEAGLRETSPEISQAQAMQLVGLVRSGKDLGTLLSAVPADKLASVLGNPRFLEGRSDKMAMLDTGISAMIKNLSAGQVSADDLAVRSATAGFKKLSEMLDSPTYGGRKVEPDMSMEGVPKSVKLLIIKHMMAQGHEAQLDDRHVQSYESGFRPVLGSSENTSWLGSLEAGKPDIFLLQDALAEASKTPVTLNALISKLDEASKSALGAPNPVVDFLTTTLLGKSMMVRLNAMASTDSAVLEGLHTKLESANEVRLLGVLNRDATPEAFMEMASSGILLNKGQKETLATAFVTKYPAGSANADADAALALLFER
jgi:hypothetical protein